MRVRNLRQTRTHHQQTNQAKTDHMAEAEDLPAEVMEAQVEVVAEATTEVSTTTTTTTTTMDIEGTAKRFHLNKTPENPSNLLQALMGKTRTRESVLRTEWATSCMT